jgi:oxygen-dependent protoporphyrinogen oxidase
METYDAIIVGGGISGLSAAYTLFKRGLEVLVIEAAPEVGGVMRSIVTPEGYVLDCGPNTAATKDPRLWAEFADLGLAARLVPADRKGKRRYVLLNGKPEEIPMSPVGLARTPLLSSAAKLRIFREPFIPRATGGDESVASFFARRLGPEPAARLVDPFVAGVYAGNPAQISVKAAFPSLWEAEQRAGSIIKGMLSGREKPAPGAPRGPKMRSLTFNFPGGLAEWPRAIAAALGPRRVWRNTRATAVRPDGALWQVTIERDRLPETLEARTVILALPAYAAAGLVEGLDARAAAALRGIPYAPVSVVQLGYRREQVRHPLDGFGVLAPSSERRRFLGILWSSSLFAGRAPAGRVLTTTLMGGALAPELALQSDADLIAVAVAEHAAVIGAAGDPELAHATRWERAIAQYTSGHDARIAELERLERERPGLAFLGSYRGGVGVPKCWHNGVALADRMGDQLARRAEAVAAD